MASWVELASLIDDCVYPPEYAKSLRACIVKHCCESALLFFEQDSQTSLMPEGQQAYDARFLKQVDDFARRTVSQVAKCFRPCLGLQLDLWLWLLCREVLRIRASQIFESVATDLNPDCLERFEDGSWSLIPHRLQKTERDEIAKRLREGRISGDLVAAAYADTLFTLTTLNARQLVIVGVKVNESDSEEVAIADLDRHWLNSLRKTEFDINAASHAMLEMAGDFRNIANELRLGGKETADEFVRKYDEDRSQRFEMHGWMCDFLITRPAEFNQMRPRFEEHFSNDRLPKEWTQPRHWKWLTDECDYLLACAVDANVRQPKSVVWRELRLLVALSMCFRTSREDPAIVSQELFGDLLNQAHNARCRLSSLWVTQPFAIETKSPVASLVNPENVGCQSFILSLPPAFHKDDLQSLSKPQLETAWRFLHQKSDDAVQLTRALQCYESALALKTAAVAAPPQIEDAWAVVSLWSTIEITLKTTERPLDLAKQRLESVVQNRKVRRLLVDALERTRDCRNDWIHGGQLGMVADEVPYLFQAVSLLLSSEINCCMKRSIS